MKFPKTFLLILLVLGLMASTDLSAAPAGGLKTFVIKAETSFWTLKGMDMVWVENLGLAQEVQASKATAKGKYQGVEYTLAKVKLDSGKDGYVIDGFLARNALIGAVTSDLGSLYKDARDAAVTEIILPVATVVALWPVPGKPDFYQIAAYDETRKIVHKDRFISAADVSVKEKDVNVALLLKAMTAMKKWEQKQKILSTIDAKYQGNAFAALVEAARQGVASGDTGIAAVPASGSPAGGPGPSTQKSVQYWSATAPLNIRREPNTQSEVVAVLEKGDFCSTSEYTAETFTVGDKTSRWYKTVQPAVGWAFGAFLEPTP